MHMSEVVALPAEGVDRNRSLDVNGYRGYQVALPAEGVDRNWAFSRTTRRGLGVALPAEGVDRNPLPLCKEDLSQGRPPRGGRG